MKAINGSESTNKKTTMYSVIVDNVYVSVNDHLLVLINQMLNSADKKLFDLADKATSDEEQMKYMDCTRIFRTERNDIGRHFFVNLNTSLTASSPGNASNNEPDELSLVDEDEMEEMVAITTMHAKAMNIYGEEVRHLEARLEYLELMCDNAIDKESIDPKHICEVFQKTIENIDISIEVKLVFYKLFDLEVCSKLEVMYKTINQMLIDNDIMPEIILTTTKQEEIQHEDEDEVSSQVADYYDPRTAIKTKPIKRTSRDVSNIVNEFMTGEMTISNSELKLPESFQRTPTKQDLAGKNCYERKEVLRALSALQNKLTSKKATASCISTEEIKKEIISDISDKHDGVVDKQVNLLDERSIDFVGMMFGAISSDETVSEIMTSLIYQLQIPVMKVAMLDRSLFEEEAHPARTTVDLLTEAGKGINVKDDHLYEDLEDVVDSILDKFDIDIATFEKAASELEGIIKKEEELTTENERKQQREVLLAHARNIVTSQMKMVSCDKRIPNNVRPLLLRHWSTLMLNRYLRHGKNSSQWLQSVLLLKLLLKCIQPIKAPAQFELLKNNHMALLEAVNDELYQTQQDKSKVAEQVTELKTLFLQMIDDYGLKVVNEGEQKLTQEDILAEHSESTEDELQEIQQQTDIAKQKIARLASSTRPGVWYELYNGEDKPIRRLKLSVILTDAAQLIFVDRKGVKVIEKDAEDFARELEENRSRILADHSTFDHALGQVIGALAA
jgi:hypothetical protein